MNEREHTWATPEEKLAFLAAANAAMAPRGRDRGPSRRKAKGAAGHRKARRRIARSSRRRNRESP